MTWKRHQKMNPEREKRIVAASRSGCSGKEIGRWLGLEAKSVYRVLDKHGVPRRRATVRGKQ